MGQSFSTPTLNPDGIYKNALIQIQEEYEYQKLLLAEEYHTNLSKLTQEREQTEYNLMIDHKTRMEDVNNKLIPMNLPNNANSTSLYSPLLNNPPDIKFPNLTNTLNKDITHDINNIGFFETQKKNDYMDFDIRLKQDPKNMQTTAVKQTPSERFCSCYGASIEENCCTCDDVKQAYLKKGWAYNSSSFKQCM